MNMILDGLPKGQKILLLKGDYPSVNWPTESRDFELCYAEIDENLEKNIEAAAEEHQPDIFCIQRSAIYKRHFDRSRFFEGTQGQTS